MKKITPTLATYLDDEAAKPYVDYFFHQFAGIAEDPIFSRSEEDENLFVSVVKDSVARTAKGGTGKFMARERRICLFYFVKTDDFINVFGSCRRKDGSVEPNTSHDNCGRLQKEAFDNVKLFHPDWLIRSYVYICFVLVNDKDSPKEAYYSIYYWNTNYSFKSLGSRTQIFNNAQHSLFVPNVKVELEELEANERDVLECVKAFQGELDYHSGTEENYKDIKGDIDDGVKYILVQGAARTGKTIIAMRLLHDYPEAKLLLMNPNIHRSLKEAFLSQGVPFPIDRIFHHDLSQPSGRWISSISRRSIGIDCKFLIVDECQRFGKLEEYVNFQSGAVYPSFDFVDKIINWPGHVCTVFLGDNRQLINPKYDEGISAIYEKVRHLSFRQYDFRTPVGVPPEVLTNALFVLDEEVDKPVASGEFRFCLHPSVSEFVESFEQNPRRSKHYVSLCFQGFSPSFAGRDGAVTILPQKFSHGSFSYLFHPEIQNKYYLSPYEVISREIQSIYIYIPKEITLDENKRIVGKLHLDRQSIIKDQLYTLLTRATLEIHVYAEDESLQQYFQEKFDTIARMNQAVQTPETNEAFQRSTTESAYRLFIAYHGTLDVHGTYAKAKEIADALKNAGVDVYLCNYCQHDDESEGFDKTTRILQRCENMLFVVNDHCPVNDFGMIPMKNADGTNNQLHGELTTYKNMIDGGRSIKTFKAFYCGNKQQTPDDRYRYLNRLYMELTCGNSGCCLTEIAEILEWLCA